MEIELQTLIENAYKKTSKFNFTSLIFCSLINGTAILILLKILFCVVSAKSGKDEDSLGFIETFTLYPIFSYFFLMVLIVILVLSYRFCFSKKRVTENAIEILKKECEEVKDEIIEIGQDLIVEELSSEVVDHYVHKISEKTKRLILLEKAIVELQY